MHMILVGLRPGPQARTRHLSPETVVDILWAAAVPEDLLEHVRARSEPGEAGVDTAIFLAVPDADSETDVRTALCLCLRAVGSAPALAGWYVDLQAMPSHATPWETL
ncbi:hypothetical protein [Catenulispora subtropica]|uniref:Uncharacterized protein n=1 Tax=Catenulispora subtropica TaxID=450798 RepID=A0ABN2R8Z0_9ACTN